jgi:hypothetical protein
MSGIFGDVLGAGKRAHQSEAKGLPRRTAMRAGKSFFQVAIVTGGGALRRGYYLDGVRRVSEDSSGTNDQHVDLNLLPGHAAAIDRERTGGEIDRNALRDRFEHEEERLGVSRLVGDGCEVHQVKTAADLDRIW